MDDDIVRDLQEKLESLTQANLNILQAAQDQSREPTVDEMAQVNANIAEFEDIEAQLLSRRKVLEQQAKLEARRAADEEAERKKQQQVPGTQVAAQHRQVNEPGSGQAQASAGGPAVVGVPSRTRPRDQATHGFRAQNEFFGAVYQAAVNPMNTDQRLYYNVGQQESVGTDGGFAVPPDFRTEIIEKVMQPESIAGRCDEMPTGSNSITFPGVDESEIWNGGPGISAYWEGEGGTITESKGKVEPMSVRANKITAMVRITEELAEDGPAMTGFVTRKAPQTIDWKLTYAIIHGTGVGMPLGILNSGFTVEAPSSTAAADVVQYADIRAMWTRMHAPWRAGGIWLIRPEIEDNLMAMPFDPTATSPYPVYLPAGGASVSPYGTLMGRPVVPHEVCNAASDPGDIIFANFSQYMLLTKGGLRQDVSMHVYFDTAELAFRFILRIGGQPWWKNPIAPRVGSHNTSAFVTLADRT